MRNEGNAARRSCSYGRARASNYRPDVHIVQQRADEEWRRGCRWAALALLIMFAVCSWGAVVLGW